MKKNTVFNMTAVLLMAAVFAIVLAGCPTDSGGSGGGVTWTAVSNDFSLIHSITYGGGKFVAMGEYGRAAYSSDGVTWTAVSSTTFKQNGTGNITGVAYGGGKFVAVGNGGYIAYWVTP